MIEIVWKSNGKAKWVTRLNLVLDSEDFGIVSCAPNRILGRLPPPSTDFRHPLGPNRKTSHSTKSCSGEPRAGGIGVAVPSNYRRRSHRAVAPDALPVATVEDYWPNRDPRSLCQANQIKGGSPPPSTPPTTPHFGRCLALVTCLCVCVGVQATLLDSVSNHYLIVSKKFEFDAEHPDANITKLPDPIMVCPPEVTISRCPHRTFHPPLFPLPPVPPA